MIGMHFSVLIPKYSTFWYAARMYLPDDLKCFWFEDRNLKCGKVFQQVNEQAAAVLLVGPYEQRGPGVLEMSGEGGNMLYLWHAPVVASQWKPL